MSNVEKEKSAAAAVGGKTARACDGCLRRRARWYCAADDAFLCQNCDASVHSANPLARRHERLRLRLASPAPPSLSVAKPEELVPAWFKRKARTPRAHHHLKSMRRMIVPELTESDETNEEEEEEEEGEEEEEEGQLLYRVPVFDPALAEFCSPPPSLQDSNCSKGSEAEESKPAVLSPSHFTSGSNTTITTSSDPGGLVGFGPSDAELKEFADNMETLLGHGLDDVSTQEDSFYMQTLGLMDSAGFGAGAAGEMLDIDFECGSRIVVEEGEEEQKIAAASDSEQRFILNLDYEAILATWESSPWTDGERPQLRLDSFWPDCMGIWMGGGGGGQREEVGVTRMRMDGGREARVTRYREKRRTRLFSKKIRYEVRKLNAEKRPRMKGRFVKRAPFAAAANTGAAVYLS